MSEATNLTEVLEEIHQKTDGEEITVGEIIDALEHRGYGPLLLASALLTATPLGAIPGVPAVTAILVILFASQILVGRSSPWVPDRVRRFSMEREKFEESRLKVEPYTKKFDKLLKPRLNSFTSKFAVRAVAVICIVLAVVMTPLEVVPFAAAAPAYAILCFSLGISAKDGLLILIGLAVTLATVGLSIYLLM